MFFRLYYILLNAGLSAITIMLTVFLKRYSDASPTEIGTLLMVLPFVSVITKPLLCAMADRHRAHREYLAASLLVMVLGYGSFIILPFFPEFVQNQGRYCWYILMVLTIIGYNAFGVVWSLGDSLVVNKCHKTNQKFGMYRLWGTISWGVFGLAIGHVNQVSFLPAYVPAFLVMILMVSIEIVLLMCWPHKDDFVMGDPHDETPITAATANGSKMSGEYHRAELVAPMPLAHMPNSMSGSMTPSQRRAAKSLANLMLEDFSNTIHSIKSTVSGGLHSRTKLDLENQSNFQQPANEPPPSYSAAAAATTTTINDSVSSRTQRTRYPLFRAWSSKQDEAHQAGQTSAHETGDGPIGPIGNPMNELAVKELDPDKEDLQLVVIKMIVTRDWQFFKYIIIFVAFGALFNIHISFFFLHLEQLTQHLGIFSQLTGMCTVSQAIAETLCFAISPWIVSTLGRDGSISLCMMLFVFRYLFNGLIYSQLSPYVCLLIEPCHGINYGIAYYIVTDISLHFALQVDHLIPELTERKLIRPDIDVNDVKNTVRATMQGIFSGAFDGLGSGLGAILAGLVLEHHTYTYLWCLCGILATFVCGAHQIFMVISYLTNRGKNNNISHAAPLDRVKH